ncbi:MAG TPA: TonB-dependent receptor [Longimicrobiaceae bacterium]|nr:TonB-dependent receptor [Longimicrobiaceae bacterium]
MRLFATASLALALTGATALNAQNPGARPPAQAPGARPQQGQPQPPAAAPGEIRGTIVDAESGQPIGAASVSVFSRADSALVAGAIAGANGAFRIQGLRPGAYSLRVSMMGYRPQAGTAVTIAAATPRANAGTIRLAKSAVALQGITATAERAQVTVAPDRNTYQTRTVAPAATNASEVLESVPAVQVDPDGRVSLRGNENVVVQINGRPSPMRGAQLASYLKQLPANTLERVEVIPNPSARQDPEGMAGIINIVLKQNVDLGLSGGVTLYASSEDRYSGSGNLGWQQGPATVFASYSYLSDTRQEVGVNDRTRLLSDSPLSYTNQDVSGSVGNRGHNLNTTLDYRLGAKNVLSSSLLVNVRGGDQNTLSDYHILDAAETPLDRYLRLRGTDTDNRMVDASLGFKRTMVPQRHELSAEVRLNRVHDLDRTDLFRQPLGGGARTDAEIDVTDATTWQVTAQLDYTRALGQRGKLETGYKGWERWLDRDYRVSVDPLGSGVFAPSDQSNALELDEGVHAAYAVLSQGTGPWELQAGLRGEYATRDFTLASTGEHFPHNYASVFPSALASYKLGEHDQVKASYSRRIRRPGTQELNPFPVFFDLQNVFLGNPRLDPEYTDAVEVGWVHSARIGSLQVSPFYRRTSNVIRFIINTADSIAGREVTSVSFENLDHGTSWGADVNGQARLGQAFSGFAGFNVFKMVTEGGGGESSLASNAVSWSARVNGTFNVTPRTSFTAQYFYRAPMNIERGRFEGMGIANFSMRQKLYGEKASVTFRVSDPFDGTRFRVQAGDDNVIQLTERTFNSRAFHVTFQYNFGRPPRVRQRPQEQPQQAPPSPFGG